MVRIVRLEAVAVGRLSRILQWSVSYRRLPFCICLKCRQSRYDIDFGSVSRRAVCYRRPAAKIVLALLAGIALESPKGRLGSAG